MRPDDVQTEALEMPTMRAQATGGSPQQQASTWVVGTSTEAADTGEKASKARETLTARKTEACGNASEMMFKPKLWKCQ